MSNQALVEQTKNPVPGAANDERLSQTSSQQQRQKQQQQGGISPVLRLIQIEQQQACKTGL